MSPTEYVALAGVVVAVFSSIFVPLYLVRRGEARSTAEALERLNKETAVSRELSWEKINEAIVKERDDLRVMLREQEIKSSTEARDLRTRLDQEASDIRTRYDRELARANDRIEACQQEVDRLRQKLYPVPGLSEHPA
jgi:hypothetical protein